VAKSNDGKIVATIEARMTSSRLPEKVLLPVMGKPMLWYLVNRLRQVPSLDDIVLATTINQEDNALIDFAEQHQLSYYRGSEEDVMQRVIGAAEAYQADVIVEITGDCPIIDPYIVEQCAQMFLNNECDYLSNAHIRSYPDGMDVQVFKLATLKQSASMTDDLLEREHVTLHIRKHPEIFKAVHLIAPKDLYWPELGLTLDELSDYELLKKVIEHFHHHNPCFSCGEVLHLLRKNPHWVAINAHIQRKGDS
jgi:spore coat polysaccharide biosynthesis protein SpsF